jgi:ABC-type amino acid transport system permease subunit
LSNYNSDSARKTKRVVGIIAIVLVAFFAILFLVVLPDLISFLIAALATSLAANWIFRRIERQKL